MLRKDLDDFDTNGKVGDWCFVNGESYIAIQLTDEKFTGSCMLPIREKDNATTTRTEACWEWDGNRDTPTLTPSILHWGNGRKEPATWHGFLRAGKLETA